MISSLHSLRRKIVVVSRILCSNIPRSSMQDQQSPRMARSASHQPSECSQTNSLSELDLEDHSSSTFNTFLSIFTSSPEWHCYSMFLQQQFQEQLVRSTVKSNMESWYIFCKWKVQSNRSRVFMSHSLIIFVICIPISTFQTRLALS